ncbi:sensor histidine kinase [Krasilnikovia sp. MM14-A1004]|uniref:sensor histidine kinase n=1 Tax=Krasilnikovia sp. MM14-A1004 TaxID=3373541 RepID=UPI00399CED94
MQLWRRVYDTRKRDAWLAGVFTGLALLPPLSTMSAIFGDLPRRPFDGFALVLVLAQTLPLILRTRRPAACLTIVGMSFALYEALAYPPQFGTVTVYLALYSVAAHQKRFRRQIAVVASVAYVVLATVVFLLGSPDRVVDFVVFYVMLTAFWALGSFVRHRRAEEAERRRMAALAATAAERTRIARELHDVVTHHVTAMVVQADATQFLTAAPERVVTGLTAIGAAGRRALTELRSLLDVLEATGDPATIGDLVEHTRQSGQPIELIEEDDAAALPVGVRLAVYRVAQEGLTNAVKYAAGLPTTVRIARRDGRVEVEVTNVAAPVPVSVGALSGGRGLGGLRDRVEMLGGELTAGEEPDGRFRLHAAIPTMGDA